MRILDLRIYVFVVVATCLIIILMCLMGIGKWEYQIPFMAALIWSIAIVFINSRKYGGRTKCANKKTD